MIRLNARYRQRICKERCFLDWHLLLLLVFLGIPLLAEAQVPKRASDSVGRPPGLPQFTPEQDSAYYRAIRLHLPPDLRFQLDLLALRRYWLEYQEQQQRSLTATIRSHLQLPDTTWLPTPQELVQYQYNLAQARMIPSVTMQQFPGLTGLTIPLQTIAQFLGIAADTEPEISFRLRSYANVEVAVYSPQAKKIATIVRGMKAPGRYTIRWNGRTDQGYPVPSGEYVLEVRVSGAQDQFVRRKLIQWKARK